MSEVTPSKPKKQSRKGLFFYGLFTKYVFCFRCHTDPKAKPSGEWDSGAFQLSFRPPAHICCLRATRAPAVMSKMQSSARAKGEVAKVETSRARSSGGEAEVEKSLPYDSLCLNLVVVRFLADEPFVESQTPSARNDRKALFQGDTLGLCPRYDSEGTGIAQTV